MSTAVFMYPLYGYRRTTKVKPCLITPMQRPGQKFPFRVTLRACSHPCGTYSFQRPPCTPRSCEIPCASWCCRLSHVSRTAARAAEFGVPALVLALSGRISPVTAPEVRMLPKSTTAGSHFLIAFSTTLRATPYLPAVAK